MPPQEGDYVVAEGGAGIVSRLELLRWGAGSEHTLMRATFLDASTAKARFEDEACLRAGMEGTTAWRRDRDGAFWPLARP